jgi:threonine aldolase
MSNPPIDLRSDTVTRPTQAMRKAMASADVGDDHYGEDPTVRALEEEVAARFAHDAAIFVPSGTMGNNIALRLLAPRGSEILADNDSHVVTYEMGSLAAVGGVQTRTLVNDGGILGAPTVAAQLRVDPDGPNGNGSNYSMVTTSAVAIENTHVRSGGRPWLLEDIDALVAVTAPVGVALHCDGARIWNAAVATGIGLEEYGQRFATLSVCLSKGLGAPVGSLVVTSADHAPQARAIRRQLGGAMRQSGILAAGGLYALHHHLERLADDHRHAKELALALEAARPDRIRADRVETNIVLFSVSQANMFVAEAARLGVLLGAISPTVVRAVTHLDITDDHLAAAGSILGQLLDADAPLPHPEAPTARADSLVG